MLINVNDLTGQALDYAVAKADGRTIRHNPMGPTIPGYWIWEEVPSGKGGVILSRCIYKKIGGEYSPSTNWGQGGPIIERERIAIDPYICNEFGAYYKRWGDAFYQCDENLLIAAMRCFVNYKLGDVVEIPAGLISKYVF